VRKESGADQDKRRQRGRGEWGLFPANGLQGGSVTRGEESVEGAGLDRARKGKEGVWEEEGRERKMERGKDFEQTFRGKPWVEEVFKVAKWFVRTEKAE